MSALQDILGSYRNAAKSEREKGNYFEELVRTYLRNENDANDWAIDTMNNPKYPLELFQRVITVSLETMKIVNALPKLDID